MSLFPKELIGLKAEDCICPSNEGGDQPEQLLRLAGQPSSRKELTDLNESGWIDAKDWYRKDSTKAELLLTDAATRNGMSCLTFAGLGRTARQL